MWQFVETASNLERMLACLACVVALVDRVQGCSGEVVVVVCVVSLDCANVRVETIAFSFSSLPGVEPQALPAPIQGFLF